MKILVVSNVYPPYYRGGYELFCKDVVEGLKKKGHSVYVLTSTFGPKQKQKEEGIFRKLVFFNKTAWEENIFFFLWAQLKNTFLLKDTIKKIKPDLIFCWNLRGMSLSIIFAIQNSGLPYCFFIDDFWLEPSLDRWFSIWDRKAGRNRIKRILKTFLHISGIAPLVDKYIPINKEKLDFQNLLFPNNEFCSLVRQLNIPLKDTFIVGQGVDTSLFSPSPHAQCNNIKLLYVGQLLKAKGVHTAIEAMEILVHKLAITNLSLEVIGEAVDKDYRLFLEKIIKGFQLENYVFFRDKLPREEIARVYREYDILIFPSIWKEPHGNVLMEAMASGMAIVSTATGGNKEFLRDGENCLIFQAGNAQDLAMKIVYLIHNEELRRKISENARKYILEYHRLDSVVDSIEETLMYILRKNRGVILINR